MYSNQHTVKYSMMNHANELIYIIDDEYEMVKLLELQFATMGYETRGFLNRIDFQHEFKSRKPAAIITDLKLGLDCGVNLAEQVYKTNPQIPIIAISGFLTKEKIQRLQKLNTIDITAKPFRVKHFATAISGLLDSMRP